MRIKNQLLLAAFTTTLILSTTSSAQSVSKKPDLPTKLPTVVNWQAGTKFTVCGNDLSSSTKSCTTLELPKINGKVRSVVMGNFVPQAAASWIVFGENKARVCALFQGKASIICAPIAAPLHSGINVSYVETKDGLGAIVFDPAKTQAQKRYAVSTMSSAFAEGLYEAIGILQGNLTKAPTVSPMLVNAGGGGCGYDEYGDYYCDAGGGGDDSGGGGGYPSDPPPDPQPPADPAPETPTPPPPPVDQGNTGCTTNGPIIICTIPGQKPDPFEPPPLPAPTTPPWSLCDTFGIGCPPPAPVPPPPIRRNIDEEVQACLDGYNADMDECSAYYGAFGYNTYLACKTRAGTYLEQCLTRARAP